MSNLFAILSQVEASIDKSNWPTGIVAMWDLPTNLASVVFECIIVPLWISHFALSVKQLFLWLVQPSIQLRLKFFRKTSFSLLQMQQFNVTMWVPFSSVLQCSQEIVFRCLSCSLYHFSNVRIINWCCGFFALLAEVVAVSTCLIPAIRSTSRITCQNCPVMTKTSGHNNYLWSITESAVVTRDDGPFAISQIVSREWEWSAFM